MAAPAIGDLNVYQQAAILLARRMKDVVSEAKQLNDFWIKLNLGATTDIPAAPQDMNDLLLFQSFLGALANFMDNVAVTAGDRRQVIERMATAAVV